MDQVLRILKPKQVEFVQREPRPLAASEVRVKTLYSGISAGTELTQYRGHNPHLEKHWSPQQRLFLSGRATPAYPLEGFGYEQVGQIVEVGPQVGGLEIGQMVWGSWNHRSSTVLNQELVIPRVLPKETNPLLGIFARIGAIALGPVHDADIHLGDTVAVFGLGVPGLIAAQLAGLSGATVIGVDGIDKRLNLAHSLGIAHVVDFRSGSPAEHIKALTANRGTDASIEISGSYRALHEAIRATAYNSRVVVAGFMHGEGMGLALGEEFHHNRIELVSSQTQGIRPTLQHRWDRLRQEQTVMRLAAEGKLKLQALVTHTFPAHQAAQAFELIDHNPSEAVQVVLDFREMP